MNIYEIPGYNEVREALLTPGRADGHHLAYLKLRSLHGSALTEREMHGLVRQISISEGKVSDFLRNLLDYLSSWTSKITSLFRSASPGALLKKVEKDLPRLKQKAREVEMTMDTPDLSQEDVQEVTRRMIERLPDPSGSDVEHLRKSLGNLQEHRADDASMSWTAFYHKWTVLYLVYALAMGLVGVNVLTLGLIKISLSLLPPLVLMIDDLLYQLGTKEFVAP